MGQKEAGEPIQADKTGDLDCQTMLEAQLGQPVHLIFRLDRPVGGVVVFAKTAKAAAALSAQVQQKTVEKIYWAVAEGKTEQEAVLTDFLRKDGRTNTSKVVPKGTKDAKEARLFYKTIQQVPEEEGTLSLVEVNLETGRHHQIRVQFASRKMPLFGDGKYGARRRYGQKGFGLFARRLSFAHPKTGKRLTFTATPTGMPFSLFSLEGGMEDGKTEKMP